ncbi:unnamed protein product [Protopolystoma xenopodis]|uniref:Uncharacterized protein n=1 Tax=Protopolystoma xenopodis TaxID=117903 RepID=A0A448WCX0_9PLAT|nr:unnamed protein product [Protopolystoma xenopodis]
MFHIGHEEEAQTATTSITTTDSPQEASVSLDVDKLNKSISNLGGPKKPDTCLKSQHSNIDCSVVFHDASIKEHECRALELNEKQKLDIFSENDIVFEKTTDELSKSKDDLSFAQKFSSPDLKLGDPLLESEVTTSAFNVQCRDISLEQDILEQSDIFKDNLDSDSSCGRDDGKSLVHTELESSDYLCGTWEKSEHSILASSGFGTEYSVWVTGSQEGAHYQEIDDLIFRDMNQSEATTMKDEDLTSDSGLLPSELPLIGTARFTLGTDSQTLSKTSSFEKEDDIAAFLSTEKDENEYIYERPDSMGKNEASLSLDDEAQLNFIYDGEKGKDSPLFKGPMVSQAHRQSFSKCLDNRRGLAQRDESKIEDDEDDFAQLAAAAGVNLVGEDSSDQDEDDDADDLHLISCGPVGERIAQGMIRESQAHRVVDSALDRSMKMLTRLQSYSLRSTSERERAKKCQVATSSSDWSYSGPKADSSRPEYIEKTSEFMNTIRKEHTKEVDSHDLVTDSSITSATAYSRQMEAMHELDEVPEEEEEEENAGNQEKYEVLSECDKGFDTDSLDDAFVLRGDEMYDEETKQLGKNKNAISGSPLSPYPILEALGEEAEDDFESLKSPLDFELVPAQDEDSEEVLLSDQLEIPSSLNRQVIVIPNIDSTPQFRIGEAKSKECLSLNASFTALPIQTVPSTSRCSFSSSDQMTGSWTDAAYASIAESSGTPDESSRDSQTTVIHVGSPGGMGRFLYAKDMHSSRTSVRSSQEGREDFSKPLHSQVDNAQEADFYDQQGSKDDIHWELTKPRGSRTTLASVESDLNLLDNSLMSPEDRASFGGSMAQLTRNTERQMTECLGPSTSSSSAKAPINLTAQSGVVAAISAVSMTEGMEERVTDQIHTASSSPGMLNQPIQNVSVGLGSSHGSSFMGISGHHTGIYYPQQSGSIKRMKRARRGNSATLSVGIVTSSSSNSPAGVSRISSAGDSSDVSKIATETTSSSLRDFEHFELQLASTQGSTKSSLAGVSREEANGVSDKGDRSSGSATSGGSLSEFERIEAELETKGHSSTSSLSVSSVGRRASEGLSSHSSSMSEFLRNEQACGSAESVIQVSPVKDCPSAFGMALRTDYGAALVCSDPQLIQNQVSPSLGVVGGPIETIYEDVIAEQMCQSIESTGEDNEASYTCLRLDTSDSLSADEITKDLLREAASAMDTSSQYFHECYSQSHEPKGLMPQISQHMNLKPTLDEEPDKIAEEDFVIPSHTSKTRSGIFEGADDYEDEEKDEKDNFEEKRFDSIEVDSLSQSLLCDSLMPSSQLNSSSLGESSLAGGLLGEEYVLTESQLPITEWAANLIQEARHELQLFRDREVDSIGEADSSCGDVMPQGPTDSLCTSSSVSSGLAGLSDADCHHRLPPVDALPETGEFTRIPPNADFDAFRQRCIGISSEDTRVNALLVDSSAGAADPVEEFLEFSSANPTQIMLDSLEDSGAAMASALSPEASEHYQRPKHLDDKLNFPSASIALNYEQSISLKIAGHIQPVPTESIRIALAVDENSDKLGVVASSPHSDAKSQAILPSISCGSLKSISQAAAIEHSIISHTDSNLGSGIFDVSDDELVSGRPYMTGISHTQSTTPPANYASDIGEHLTKAQADDSSYIIVDDIPVEHESQEYAGFPKLEQKSFSSQSLHSHCGYQEGDQISPKHEETGISTEMILQENYSYKELGEHKVVTSTTLEIALDKQNEASGPAFIETLSQGSEVSPSSSSLYEKD